MGETTGAAGAKDQDEGPAADGPTTHDAEREERGILGRVKLSSPWKMSKWNQTSQQKTEPESDKQGKESRGSKWRGTWASLSAGVAAVLDDVSDAFSEQKDGKGKGQHDVNSAVAGAEGKEGKETVEKRAVTHASRGVTTKHDARQAQHVRAHPVKERSQDGPKRSGVGAAGTMLASTGAFLRKNIGSAVRRLEGAVAHAGQQHGERGQGVAMRRGGEREAAARAARVEQLNEMLPWNNVVDDDEIRLDLRARILAVSADYNVLLRPIFAYDEDAAIGADGHPCQSVQFPQQDGATEEEYISRFYNLDSEVVVERMMALLAIDKRLERMRSILVPQRISESLFVGRYLRQVDILKRATVKMVAERVAALARSPARPQPMPQSPADVPAPAAAAVPGRALPHPEVATSPGGKGDPKQVPGETGSLCKGANETTLDSSLHDAHDAANTTIGGGGSTVMDASGVVDAAEDDPIEAVQASEKVECDHDGDVSAQGASDGQHRHNDDDDDDDDDDDLDEAMIQALIKDHNLEEGTDDDDDDISDSELARWAAELEDKAS